MIVVKRHSHALYQRRVVTLTFQDLRIIDRETKKFLHTLIDTLCNSGIYVSGDFTNTLRGELSEFTGIEDFVMVGNGTNALEIILRFLRTAGHKVVGCQTNAGGYSTGAALLNGYKVVPIDVNPLTGLVQCSNLEEAYSREKFDLLIYTHLYGNGQDLHDIKQFCDLKNIEIVEDCAQAFGLRINRVHVGNFGRFSAFSFYPTKNLGGLGDAGAIGCSKKDFHSIKSLSQYGWNARYSIELANGTNSRIDEIQAAILSYRLSKLNAETLLRVGKYRIYQENIPKRVGSLLSTPNTVAHLAVLKCKNRGAVVDALKKSNIPFAVHYPIPDHLQKAWRNLFGSLKLPTSESLSRSILSLPLGVNYHNNQIMEICELISRVERKE